MGLYLSKANHNGMHADELVEIDDETIRHPDFQGMLELGLLEEYDVPAPRVAPADTADSPEPLAGRSHTERLLHGPAA